jgi:tRNA modification GTPase
VRTSEDEIERLGIERTRRAISDADFIVVVLDGSQPLTAEDEEIIKEASDNLSIIALNKSDLESFCVDNARIIADGLPTISVSAKTKNGLNSLCAAIIEPFSSNRAQESSFVITNARHYDLLRRTWEALNESERLIRHNVSEELIAAKLYQALQLLGEITGETTPDDILSQIFSTFCIGK